MIRNTMKFFEPSVANYADGARVTASSGDGNLALSIKGPQWQSRAGSDPEELSLTLPRPMTVNRIMLINHNFSSFSVNATGLNQGTDINNRVVSGRDALVVSDNTLPVSYFAFPELEITTLNVTVTSSFPKPFLNKFLGSLLLMNEIGTFDGYPALPEVPFMMNEKTTKTKAGTSFVNKQQRTLGDVTLEFVNYTKPNDIALASQLFERIDPFLWWPSGGYQNFRYRVDGFRLTDIFRVQTVGAFNPGLQEGSYSGLIDADLNLVESI